MLFTVIFTSLSLYAFSAHADDFTESARAAHESRKLYENQKAQDNNELSADIQEMLDIYSHYLETPQPEAEAVAKDIVGTARAYNTDERRKGIFEKGTIVGGISNEVFAQAEEARRDELGLDKEDQLYIFVSRSMPDELIRSYALDAAYSGGILVMRGIGDDERLADFVRSQYMQNIKPEGVGAMVQLDPRLFDAFDIQVVPSIVYTDQSLADLCADRNSTPLKCTRTKDDSYYKIAGSVTVKYALEQFLEAGASEGAGRFIKTLQGGYQTGSADNPSQVAGIDIEEYKAYLNKLVQSAPAPTNSEYVFEQGTDLLQRQVINTPFGPVEAPVGTQLLLRNIGGMETVFSGEASTND